MQKPSGIDKVLLHASRYVYLPCRSWVGAKGGKHHGKMKHILNNNCLLLQFASCFKNGLITLLFFANYDVVFSLSLIYRLNNPARQAHCALSGLITHWGLANFTGHLPGLAPFSSTLMKVDHWLLIDWLVTAACQAPHANTACSVSLVILRSQQILRKG